MHNDKSVVYSGSWSIRLLRCAALALALGQLAGCKKAEEPAPEPQPPTTVAPAPEDVGAVAPEADTEVPPADDAAVTTEPSAAPDAEGPVAVADVTAPEADAMVPLALATVTLDDAGAEPRRVLRLAPKAGAEQRVAVSLGLSVDMRLGDQDIPRAQLPTARLRVKATIASVDEGGAIHYDLEVEDAGFDDEVGAAGAVAKLAAGLATMKGLRGSGGVTARGVSERLEMALPADLPPELSQLMLGFRQALAQLAVPLPEEAVGVGARWKVAQEVSQGGLAVTQTTEFQLSTLGDGQFTAHATVTQTAAGAAAMDAGGRLSSFDGTGEGETVVELGWLMPVSGTSKIHTVVKGELGEGAAARPMTMVMDVEMAIGPVEATP